MSIKGWFIVIFSLAWHFNTQAQSRYFTRTGQITFFSEELIENIDATNKQVSSFLDISTGEIVFSVPMKAFKFKKSLMQEHFNENYIESEKYPKSTFKGIIDDVVNLNLSQGAVHKVKVNGLFTLHGVTKPVNADGFLSLKNGKILANAVIYVKPEDYAIEIPVLMRNKIAKIIKVSIAMAYDPYLASKTQ